MPSILEVKDLVKKYGDFTAVKGISLTSRKGDLQPARSQRRRQDHHHLHALHPFAPTSGDAVWAVTR